MGTIERKGTMSTAMRRARIASVGAGLLVALSLMACSPDPEPTRQSSAPSGASAASSATNEAAPTWTDIGEARRRAESYTGPKCFGWRPKLLGTPGDDVIHATSKDDVIVTLGGSDVVVAPNGAKWVDKICTGAGNDKVVYTWPDGGIDGQIELGRGDDRAIVTGAGTRIVAGAGDDMIIFRRNSWGDVAPGPGDDRIRGPRLRGEFRTTCVDLRSSRRPIRINLARGRATGQGHDRFQNARCAFGSRFDDVLLGTSRNDWVDGGGGLDLVQARAGDDHATGGFSTFSATGWNQRSDRADRVYLGAGDDTGDGDLGWDRVYGGTGSDEITGGTEGDYLDGGPGDDYLYGGYGCLEIMNSAGALEEMLTESWRRVASGRWTRVLNEPNEVFGGAGNDFLAGDRGNDRLDGGSGFDSGTGGYYDGRIDWITSLERPDYCESRTLP